MSWKGIAPWVLAEAGVVREGDLTYIPYRTASGELHNRRVVSDTGRRWWAETGRVQLPFGLERLPRPSVAALLPALLCEGESDTLAAREAFGQDLAQCFGIPGAASWQPSWACYFERFPLLYVVADGDDAGRAMLNRIAADLPWARRVELPEGLDLRELLQGENGRDRALELFAHADAEAEALAAWKASATLADYQLLQQDEARHVA